MNLTKFFACSSLAAGMLLGTTAPLQAGVVINGDLYAPVNVKATLSFPGKNGKFKKWSLNNKDILAVTETDQNGNQLAMRSDNNQLYVINAKQKVVVADLYNQEYAYLSFDSYVSTYSESKNEYKWLNQGSFDLYLYDYFEDGYNVVDIYGNCTIKHKETGGGSSVPAAQPKASSPNVRLTYTFEAIDVQAESYDYYDGEGYDNYQPGTGTVNASGEGKVYQITE